MDGIVLVSYVLLWIVVLVQTIALIEVLRQIGIFRRRLGDEPGALITEAGLERGSMAPAFARRDLHSGKTVTQQDLRGRTSMLVFLSPRCQSCRDLVPHLPQFAQQIREEAAFFAVCSGPADECERLMRTVKLGSVLIDPDQSMAASFRSLQTPTATVLDAKGHVRIQGITSSVNQLAGLLDEEGTAIGHRQWLLVGKEVSEEPAAPAD